MVHMSILLIILPYIVIFFLTLFTDWLWAYYIKHTAGGNVWKATFSSGAIVVAGAYVTVSYKALIIPAILGGMTGTYLSVKK